MHWHSVPLVKGSTLDFTFLDMLVSFRQSEKHLKPQSKVLPTWEEDVATKLQTCNTLCFQREISEYRVCNRHQLLVSVFCLDQHWCWKQHNIWVPPFLWIHSHWVFLVDVSLTNVIHTVCTVNAKLSLFLRLYSRFHKVAKYRKESNLEDPQKVLKHRCRRPWFVQVWSVKQYSRKMTYLFNGKKCVIYSLLMSCIVPFFLITIYLTAPDCIVNLSQMHSNETWMFHVWRRHRKVNVK